MFLAVAAEKHTKNRLTLPTYRLCTAAGAGSVTFTGGVRTAESTRATSRARLEPPVPIRDNGLVHISPRHVKTPNGVTALHYCPRFATFLLVIFVSPPTLAREKDGVAHAPASHTLRPAQHKPVPKTRHLLDSHATLASFLVLLGWAPLWPVICEISLH